MWMLEGLPLGTEIPEDSWQITSALLKVAFAEVDLQNHLKISLFFNISYHIWTLSHCANLIVPNQFKPLYFSV
jgi:hypothetical protein